MTLYDYLPDALTTAGRMAAKDGIRRRVTPASYGLSKGFQIRQVRTPRRTTDART